MEKLHPPPCRYSLYSGGTAILSSIVPGADWMRKIMFFEGLMLSFFALFKLLDVKGFQEGYSTYDLIAKQVPAWGYIYPFLELGLGVLLLLNIVARPASYSIALLAIIGIVGVAIELKKDRKFQCACLGTALKVPLTKVTLIENGIMLVLALVMVVGLSQTSVNSTMTMHETTGQTHIVNIANDREFLEHMIPHHQEAVDSSRIVAGRTQNTQVKQLAETIVAAQTKEIGEMKEWYKSWYGTEYGVASSYKAMMSSYESTPLEDIDDQYLSEMIGHHEGAIDAAQHIRDKAEHGEVKTLAQNIIDTQRGEIDVMRSLITMPAATSHGGH